MFIMECVDFSMEHIVRHLPLEMDDDKDYESGEEEEEEDYFEDVQEDETDIGKDGIKINCVGIVLIVLFYFQMMRTSSREGFTP